MTRRAREWKAWRAAARGELSALPEDQYRSFRQKAEEDRKTGYGWFADGLDDESTDVILGHLRRVGIDIDAEGFVAAADGQPGPKELSDVWEQRAVIHDERDVYLPWLAARTLWARLLPDETSIETEADAIEAGMRAARKGGNAEVLYVLQRIAAAADGSPDVFDALDDELHINLGSWVLTRVAEAKDVEDVEPWVAAAAAIEPALETDGIGPAAIAMLLARNGHPDRARDIVSQVMVEFGDNGTVVHHVADVHIVLGDGTMGERMAARAIALAEDDDEAEGVRSALKEALALQGREVDEGRVFMEALAERRRRELERRAERRRREKRGGKKKGRKG